MKRLTIQLVALFAAVAASAKITPPQAAQLPPPAAGKVQFTRDIKPIFDASCVKCHGRGKAKGGFSLETRELFLKGGDTGAPAAAGKSAESLLVELVAGFDPEKIMPEKGSKLTPKQIGLLRAWIDQGLPWDDGVTFAKPPPNNLTPRQPKLPAARAGLENPVDRLLQPYFEAHKIKPAAPVEDRVFARRVYLDVIGVLPEPAELDVFLADKSPAKRERLVQKLLADNSRYAAHWLSFWNDALRNDYRGAGYIDDGRQQISTWLYSALAKNMPYDQFVAQLINPNAETAGFTKGIVWRGAINASQTPPIQAAQNISQVFMGVNLKCASCHDSFINDWALADAYGLASVYSPTALEMFKCDKPTGKTAGVKFIFPELGEIKADAPKAERMKRLAEIMTSKPNGRLTRTIVNRFWAKFLGRGLVDPVDEMDSPSWNSDVLDWLAEDLAGNGYDLKRTMQTILTSRAYQLPAISMDEQKHADFVFSGPVVRRMSAEQFRDALGTLTGIWHDAPAAAFDLAAGFQGAVHDDTLMPRPVHWVWSHPKANESALAQTIYFRKTVTLDAVPASAFATFSADNTAKLFVNGKEVAKSAEWTKPKAIDIRGQLKKGENVFAIAAVNNTKANKPPPANVPPNEADASAAGLVFYAQLRDGARVLDFATDASWVCSTNEEKGWETGATTNAAAWQPAVELGGLALAPWNAQNFNAKFEGALAMAMAHVETRASLVAADPLALALGRPPREQVSTTRPSAATTLQALELTNGDTLAKLLKRGAANKTAATTSAGELVTQLFRQALGRQPTPVEAKLSQELVGQPVQKEGVEDLLWSLAMLPEFQLIY